MTYTFQEVFLGGSMELSIVRFEEGVLLGLIVFAGFRGFKFVWDSTGFDALCGFMALGFCGGLGVLWSSIDFQIWCGFYLRFCGIQEVLV